MRRIKAFALLVLAMAAGLTFAGTAYANVAVTDMSGKMSAVLHLDPNSPVTGKETTITFTLDAKTRAAVLTPLQAGLTVIDRANNIGEPVALKVNGGAVTGKYTFKKAGAYTLRLILAGGKDGFTFYHDQEVAAGPDVPATRTSPTTRSLGWLLVVIAIIIAVVVVALRRPKVKL
jgi:hypothetical protein